MFANAFHDCAMGAVWLLLWRSLILGVGARRVVHKGNGSLFLVKLAPCTDIAIQELSRLLDEDLCTEMNQTAVRLTEHGPLRTDCNSLVAVCNADGVLALEEELGPQVLSVSSVSGPGQNLNELQTRAAVAEHLFPPEAALDQKAVAAAVKSSSTSDSLLQRSSMEFSKAVRERMQFNSEVVAGLLSKPSEFAGALFALFAFLQFIKTVCLDSRKAAANVDEKRHALQQETQVVQTMVREMNKELGRTQETQAHQAELHFRERHRVLTTFLDEIARNRTLCEPDSKLLNPFRSFMRQWLQAFESCSLDPDNEPTILCNEYVLAQGRTVAETAGYIFDQALDQMKDLRGKHLQAAVKDVQQRMTDPKDIDIDGQTAVVGWQCSFWFCCFQRKEASRLLPLDLSICCLKLTIISFWQLMLLLLALCGTGLAALLHVTQSHIIAACVDVGTFLLLTLQSYAGAFDEDARLNFAHGELAVLRTDVAEARRAISLWLSQERRVKTLWDYQTQVSLELFEAVAQAIQFPPGPYDTDVERQLHGTLMKLSNKMSVVMSGMGEASMYMTPLTIQEDMLDFASQQMLRSLGRINEVARKGQIPEVLQCLDCFSTFVVLRVIGASNLPNLDASLLDKSNKTDAFVIVRIGNAHRKDSLRTRVINDSLDPTWNEEFVLSVPPGATELTLEVFDCDNDQWTDSADEAIGYVAVPFPNLAGKWHRKDEHVLDFKRGRNVTGKSQKLALLEFELFHVTAMKQLQFLEEAEPELGSPTQPDAMMGVSSFLSLKSAKAGVTHNRSFMRG